MKKRLGIIFEEYQNTRIIMFFLGFLIFAYISKNKLLCIGISSILVCIIIRKIQNRHSINQLTKTLKFKEIEKIEKEIQNHILLKNYQYTMTESYIIIKGSMVGILKYCDITCMKKKHSYNFNLFNSSYILFANKKKYKILIGTSKMPVFNNDLSFENIINSKNRKIVFKK